MRLTAFCFLAICLIGLAIIQQPAAAQGRGGRGGSGSAGGRGARPDKKYASATEIEAIMASNVKSRTPAQTIITQSIISLAPYNALLEYRPAPGVAPAAIHPTEAEFFYIVTGNATLVTGGTIVDNKIEGGTEQKLGKGDFVIVPENTNHWFKDVSDNFFDMGMHVPRPVPAAGAAAPATELAK